MRITEDQAKILGLKRIEHKKNKFNAVKEVVAGITNDSIREGKRRSELEFQQHCGFISDLIIKPKSFVLLDGFRNKNFKRKFSAITYQADFSYIKDGKLIYEESKGKKTEPYLLRRKLLLSRYPDINFIET